MKASTIYDLIHNFRRHRPGFCNVCGKRSLFFCLDAESARNTMLCAFCRSCSRTRHVAKTLLDIHDKANSSMKALSHELPFTIYNTAASDSLTKYLRQSNNYSCSEFFPGVKPGEKKNGILCQDIQNLEFKHESFDVLITEDVLEHVPDFKQAFSEILRVLRKGGHHIFSLPFYFDRQTTTRAVVDDSKIRHIRSPAFHSDSLREKILVFTDFGFDLFDFLKSLGFETAVRFSTYSDLLKLGISDSYVFISKKT
ncbi:class I SAM-dependent methyltransferase [Fibrobacterota bacterium]